MVTGSGAEFFESEERGQVDIAGGSTGGLRGFIAQLADVRRNVKIRSANSIVWRNASRGAAVGNNDAVQTFADSRARVEFTQDNELRIGQNSLVVFRGGSSDPFLQQRDAAVVVMDGELVGVVNADYGPFAVQFPAGLVELRSKPQSAETVNFRIGVNPDESSTIAIYSGQADINIAGDHYLVSASYGLTIAKDGSTDGVEALPTLPAIRAPNDGAVVKYLDVPPRVEFRWSAVPNGQTYRLEIASDANFESAIVDKYFDETSFTHRNLAPGDYYWRVSARSGWAVGPASLPRRLRVLRDSEAPLLELRSIEPLTAGSYVLRGRTATGSKVFVHGQLVTASADGYFEYVFYPDPGTQSIVVESIDTVGNVAYASQVLHVPGNSGRSE